MKEPSIQPVQNASHGKFKMRKRKEIIKKLENLAVDNDEGADEAHEFIQRQQIVLIHVKQSEDILNLLVNRGP